jgi:hypothetical protein
MHYLEKNKVGEMSKITKKYFQKEKNLSIAERSFDLRTSGLWAQHASTAPLCFHIQSDIKKHYLYLSNILQEEKLISNCKNYQITVII